MMKWIKQWFHEAGLATPHPTGLQRQIDECRFPSNSKRGEKKYSAQVIIYLVHSETGSTSLGRPSILNKRGKFRIIFSSIIIPPRVKMQQLLNVSSPVFDWTEEYQLKKDGSCQADAAMTIWWCENLRSPPNTCQQDYVYIYYKNKTECVIRYPEATFSNFSKIFH